MCGFCEPGWFCVGGAVSPTKCPKASHSPGLDVSLSSLSFLSPSIPLFCFSLASLSLSLLYLPLAPSLLSLSLSSLSSLSHSHSLSLWTGGATEKGECTPAVFVSLSLALPMSKEDFELPAKQTLFKKGHIRSWGALCFSSLEIDTTHMLCRY